MLFQLRNIVAPNCFLFKYYLIIRTLYNSSGKYNLCFKQYTNNLQIIKNKERQNKEITIQDIR